MYAKAIFGDFPKNGSLSSFRTHYNYIKVDGICAPFCSNSAPCRAFGGAGVHRKAFLAPFWLVSRPRLSKSPEGRVPATKCPQTAGGRAPANQHINVLVCRQILGTYGSQDLGNPGTIGSRIPNEGEGTSPSYTPLS